MIPRTQIQPPAGPATPPLRPGAGMLHGRNPLGFWMQGAMGGGEFNHPFPVYVSAMSARIGRGLILANIAVEPRIGAVPISGDAENAQPTLRLDSGLANELGESWVCVEVTPDAEGNLDAAGKSSKVEVVQRAHPMVALGETGRAPLALLVFDGTRARVYQIAHFHLRYETAAIAGGKRRHYFL